MDYEGSLSYHEQPSLVNVLLSSLKFKGSHTYDLNEIKFREKPFKETFQAC